MSKLVDLKEIQALLKSIGEKRYEYSIKKIADNNEIWVIGDESGIGTYKDDEGRIVFPIWPSKEFAALCCVGEYEKYFPEAIDTGLFRSDYIQDFIKNKNQLVVFPLPDDRGVLIDAEQFDDDLLIELDKY